MAHSHLLFGENRTRRAPEEKDDGVATLLILRPSPSSGLLGRRWKTLISDMVDTTSKVPSALKLADVMLASPLISILATSFRPFATGSSSSCAGTCDLFRRQI